MPFRAWREQEWSLNKSERSTQEQNARQKVKAKAIDTERGSPEVDRNLLGVQGAPGLPQDLAADPSLEGVAPEVMPTNKFAEIS